MVAGPASDDIGPTCSILALHQNCKRSKDLNPKRFVGTDVRQNDFLNQRALMCVRSIDQIRIGRKDSRDHRSPRGHEPGPEPEV